MPVADKESEKQIQELIYENTELQAKLDKWRARAKTLTVVRPLHSRAAVHPRSAFVVVLRACQAPMRLVGAVSRSTENELARSGERDPIPWRLPWSLPVAVDAVQRIARFRSPQA